MVIKDLYFDEKRSDCPTCGYSSARHSKRTKKLKDLCDYDSKIIVYHHYVYHCKSCSVFFTPTHLVGRNYTDDVRHMAICLINDQQMTYEKAATYMLHVWNVDVPASSIHDWCVASLKQ